MKAKLFRTTSVFVLSLAFTTTAAAQTIPPPGSSDQTSETESSGVDPTLSGGSPGAPAGVAQEATASDIVVTGYRASLATAQDIKRRSDSIVDAVVAQDIGKLPDITAAESLARITGIQVSRTGDEANQVLVRGLGGATTTFNGRDIFTDQKRRYELQDFPSGALAGIEVYKSGTADLLEPGLAGLINVRSWRPFDFKGTAIAGGIRGAYNDQTKKLDPTGNILATARADTGIGEVGVLVNVSYSQARYRNAVRFGSGGIPGQPNSAATFDPPGLVSTVRFPETVGIFNDSGKRWRPAVNASAQWKPAWNLEVYYDFLFQGFRAETENDQFNVPLDGSGLTPLGASDDFQPAAPSFTDIVLVDGRPDQVQSFRKSGGRRPESYRNAGTYATNTYQAAGGIKWEIGRAHLSTDLAYTRSRYTVREGSLDQAFTGPTDVDVNFFDQGGVTFALPNFDPADPSNYLWRGYYNRRFDSRGSGWQWRGDLDLETDVSWLTNLQTGFRYTDRDSSQQQGTRYGYTELLGIPLASLPVGDLELAQNAFRGDEQGFTSWLVPSHNGIDANAEALRQLTYASLLRLVAAEPDDQGYRDALGQFSTEEVAYDPLQAFTGVEQSYAFYGQGKYAFDIGSVGIDGVFGARLVNTVGQYTGTNSVTFDGETVREPRTVRQNYVDVLPNVSVRIRPTSTLQFRMAFTKTRTRPDFGQLNPSLRVSQNTAPPDPNSSSPRPNAFGDAGNPDLAPLTSNNYDITAEWYPSRSASVTFSLFYRDLFGFINNYTRQVQDPVYGLLQVNRPENAGAGKIKGIELAGQTFFDFLPGPWSGFGVQLNGTYIDGQNRLPAVLGDDTPFVKIPGLSEWTYNATLFYEKDKLATRLSYNGRSDYVNFYSQVNPDAAFTGESTRAVTRLDFSFNYTPIEQLTLTFDANNLLAKPFRNYAQYLPDRYYPRDVRDEGRFYGLGLRFRFGN